MKTKSTQKERYCKDPTSSIAWCISSQPSPRPACPPTHYQPDTHQLGLVLGVLIVLSRLPTLTHSLEPAWPWGDDLEATKKEKKETRCVCGPGSLHARPFQSPPFHSSQCFKVSGILSDASPVPAAGVPAHPLFQVGEPG